MILLTFPKQVYWRSLQYLKHGGIYAFQKKSHPIQEDSLYKINVEDLSIWKKKKKKKKKKKMWWVGRWEKNINIFWNDKKSGREGIEWRRRMNTREDKFTVAIRQKNYGVRLIYRKTHPLFIIVLYCNYAK